MTKFKAFAGIVAVVVTIGVGVAIGYLIWGYRGGGGEPVDRWQVSKQTMGVTAEDIAGYKCRIAELEEDGKRREAELLAAVQADFYAPPATTIYEAEVPEGQPEVLTWTWLERGGGSGLADFGERDVRMDWNRWFVPVDVEVTREADGKLGVTVSTTEKDLELEQVKFYADDPWKEKWYEKFEAGLAVGWGAGCTVQGHAGYSGWNIYLQRNQILGKQPADSTVMVGKDVRFF